MGIFLGIASIKRMQGMYQGTLVAQGAFSLYTTDILKQVGGWPDAIGEDIVLTWKMLRKISGCISNRWQSHLQKYLVNLFTFIDRKAVGQEA